MQERFFIPWISFLLFMAGLHVHAQSINDVVGIADKAYSNGEYQKSLVEYQRAWVFSESDSLNTYIFDQISKSHLMLGSTDQAIHYKELAYKNASGIDRSRLILESMPLYIEVKNYGSALRVLIGIPTYSQEMKDEKNVYLGILNFQMGNFEQSGEYFNRVAMDTTFVREQLNSKKLYRPKAKIAKAFSYIIPGTGQFYSGDVKSGLASSVLMGSIIYVGYNLFTRYYWYSALLGAGPFYQRYYMGGVKNAGDVAEKKQYKNRKKILMSILTKIKEEQ